MKAVILIVVIVGLIAFGILPTLTGNVARNPMPWPGIDPLTLTGQIRDINGNDLPPGRLLAYTIDGQPFGEGGASLISDYTITLAQGWHEQDPMFTITYYNYQSLVEYYCTSIDLREVSYRPTSQSTIYDFHIQCQFDQRKPEPDWPIITQARKQGDFWVV